MNNAQRAVHEDLRQKSVPGEKFHKCSHLCRVGGERVLGQAGLSLVFSLGLSWDGGLWFEGFQVAMGPVEIWV